jgi:hypothetical protein
VEGPAVEDSVLVLDAADDIEAGSTLAIWLRVTPVR